MSKQEMPEPAAGAEISYPTSQSKPVAEMPIPVIGSAASHGEMPARETDDQAASAEMPTTSMNEPVPGSVMPTGSMSGGGEGDKDASRFGLPDLAPGTLPTAHCGISGRPSRITAGAAGPRSAVRSTCWRWARIACNQSVSCGGLIKLTV